MGLAEPRKRLKISHDPNNLAWSQSSTPSYGQRLLISQGWKKGEALGNPKSSHKHRGLGAGKSSGGNGGGEEWKGIQVVYKDDLLGLGAKLTSQDIEKSRHGLDAFQGLLGRLNGRVEQGRDATAEEEEEKKSQEEKKLALYSVGKWVGVRFVSGGLLVQGEGYRDAKKLMGEDGEIQDKEENGKKGGESEDETQTQDTSDQPGDRTDEKSKRREDKEERRRRRKEEKKMLRLKKEQGLDVSGPETDSSAAVQKDSKSADKDDDQAMDELAEEKEPKEKRKEKKQKKEKERKKDRRKESSLEPETNDLVEGINAISTTESHRLPAHQVSVTRTSTSIPSSASQSATSTPPPSSLRNGRHLLRGRNIQAKRMAFADAKMLDEIFMKQKA